MDGSRFDFLARSLASRRAGLRALLAAGTLLLMGENEAAAGCKKAGKKCDKNKDCCDGAKCKGNGGKKKGKCRCKSGLKDCDGTCASLADDDANCGACDLSCAADEFCSDSACQACVPLTLPFEPPAGICTSDRECCGNGLCCTFDDVGGPESLCIDVRTHTTACGTSCDTLVNCFNTDQICVDGVCVDPPAR
jgi:hypothetical protein